MKAYLILEDGNVFEGESVGANKEVVSEFVFNTSMLLFHLRYFLHQQWLLHDEE